MNQTMPIERIQIHSRTDRFILCPGCLANADVPAANIQPMPRTAGETTQDDGVYNLTHTYE